MGIIVLNLLGAEEKRKIQLKYSQVSLWILHGMCKHLKSFQAAGM